MWRLVCDDTGLVMFECRGFFLASIDVINLTEININQFILK